jgi:FemAB-related protein (PEP-CTERM system-associated)
MRVLSDHAPDVCDAYVRSHPHATPYHLHAWLGLIERAFGHRGVSLAAETDGRIAGVLPVVFFDSRIFGRFAVSVPFVNYGGVLADTPEAEQALLARAVEEATRAGCTHLELRHAGQHFPALAAKRHKVAMVLGLADSVDGQWNGLDRKVRNQVRKGEKSALTIEHGGIELVPAFYTVFARNMRDLGTPVYGIRFFEEVCRTFPEQTRVFVVRANGQPVASSIVHWLGTVIQVPWASALREANSLSANVFLYWQMVKYAVEHGFKAFDFGRSTPNEGTFHFKKQWGAEPMPLVWEYWTSPGHAMPDLSPANPKFDLAIRVWQRLPVGLTTVIGPPIVRNIP